MTYHYTDEQLNNVNWNYSVYSVNKTFVKNYNEKARKNGEKEIQYITPTPQNKNEKNIIYTQDGQRFQVVATKTDKETGFDGMAVAPIVNGKPDYQSVAIIAAGTDPNNKTENPAWNGIVSRDFQSAIDGKLSGLSPQYKILDKFVKEVKDDPRYQVTHLSGYSQGSYVLKAGAKYGIPVTTFNSWFKYESLTKKEKDFLTKHPDLYRDYRKIDDEVVKWNDGNHPGLYYNKDHKLDDSIKIYWVDGTSHKIEDWKFDKKTGRVINENGQVLASQSTQAVLDTVRVMTQFKDLKKKLSAGGLSRSEQIFLDSVQGTALGSAIAAAAQMGADQIASLAQNCQAQAEELWAGIDFTRYQHLSPAEVEAAFAAEGVTRASLVEEFQVHSEAVKDKAASLAGDFADLSGRLQQGMEQVLATDQKMAREFQVWKDQM
ncbi:hypothetical protein [Streptococcus oricebi]|uniref:Triacylglycerol lipase n=1 Tax=Streptococcus oricebi TaxID=1547447 RepID=A0ABS5B639_9STRE|nr:hypothetical protein [Streptococcus oricebi]MBP2624297.1 hypothetical protein [Streptococcus oricebi]